MALLLLLLAQLALHGKTQRRRRRRPVVQCGEQQLRAADRMVRTYCSCAAAWPRARPPPRQQWALAAACATSRNRGRKPIMRCAASAPLLLLHARAVPRAPAPLAVSDGALVVVAAGLAGAAGWLQYSLSSGDKGLNAFLGREKMNNPFYSKDYVSEKPSAPRWLSNIRLPALPFVEVYGDSRSSSTRGGDDPQLAALYRQMDDAIESEAYDIAAKYKVKIDKMLAERAEDGRST